MLPARGFVVIRQAVSVASRTRLVEALAGATGGAPPKVAKVEAGGRVYTDYYSDGDLDEMSSSLRPSLQVHLDSLHAAMLLPPRRSPTAADASTPPQVGAGVFIRVNTSLMRAGFCPSCTTRACQASTCPSNVDWHVDGDGSRGVRLHKLWLLLEKEEGAEGRAHGNIVVAPSTGLDSLTAAALAVDPQPLLRPKRSPKVPLAEDPFAQDLLERIGCTVALDPGDAVFFTEDVWHRTQDLLADRLAMLLNVV